MDIIDTVTDVMISHKEADNIKVLNRVGLALQVAVAEWEDKKISRKLSLMTFRKIMEAGDAALKELSKETKV